MPSQFHQLISVAFGDWLWPSRWPCGEVDGLRYSRAKAEEIESRTLFRRPPNEPGFNRRKLGKRRRSLSFSARTGCIRGDALFLGWRSRQDRRRERSSSLVSDHSPLGYEGTALC